MTWATLRDEINPAFDLWDSRKSIIRLLDVPQATGISLLLLHNTKEAKMWEVTDEPGIITVVTQVETQVVWLSPQCLLFLFSFLILSD